jgi:hypothetical protein
VRLLIEAGPLAVAWDTTSPRARTTTDRPMVLMPPDPMRTVEPDGSEMWVAHRQVVESWLREAADRGPDGVAELMIELDLQDADDGRAA